MKREEAMQVFQMRSAKFTNTQTIQWKMNISIWTLLTFSIYYHEKIFFEVLGTNDRLLFFGKVLLGLFFLLIHFWFCKKLQFSLECDKAVNDDIVRQLESSDDEVNVNVNLGKEPAENKGGEWIAIQVLVTFVLSIIFVLS